MAWGLGAMSARMIATDETCGATTTSQRPTAILSRSCSERMPLSHDKFELSIRISHRVSRRRFYPAWYKAISDAVISVDSQLTVGGPASSDCWPSGIDGSKCYGGHLRPTVDELLRTVGMNWALGIVE